MNAISVVKIETVVSVWDIVTNSSLSEERGHLNSLAICDIFHLEAKATGLSRLKWN